MSTFSRAAALMRRALARHPSTQWAAIVTLSVAVAAAVHDHTRAVDEARDEWGRGATVWVTARPHRPGDPLVVERRELPAAMVPAAAIGDRDRDAIARHDLAAGEIVTDVDVAAPDGPLALAPAGWIVAPIVESPPSGAAAGERVRVVSDGVVIADEALVVGEFDGALLVAVPAEAAPRLPAASEAGAISVLRIP